MNEKSNEKQKNQDKIYFSQNVAFFRKRMNLSQMELAKKLDTSNKNISKWENCETIPDVFMISKLANIFNVSIETLIRPISNENKQAIKTQNAVPFKWKICLILFINSLILLLACALFTIFKSLNFEPFHLYYIFIYVTPVLALNTFIFMCITTKRVEPISLSLFGWLLFLCIYISFINVKNIGYIFIVSGAFQILVILFARLINSKKIIQINKILINKLRKEDVKKEDKDL